MDFSQKVDTGLLLSNNPRISDGTPQGLRVGPYGNMFVTPTGQGKSNLAWEGSYFTVNNNQTGIATGATPTAFSATNPFLLVFNSDLVKSIILDFGVLVATAAGTAGTSVQAAVTLDNGNRYTSGGTNITPNIFNCNGNVGSGSIAKIFAGNIVASAATAAVRTLTGQRMLKSAIPVAGDNYILKFGSDDCGTLISTATITFSQQPVAPLVIGPNMSALIHIWLPSQSAASSYAPELYWWEH